MSEQETTRQEQTTFDEARSRIEQFVKMKQSRQNMPFQQNRIGRFSIDRRTLVYTDDSVLGQLFGMLIIVRAEADFSRDAVDYMAYSTLFPPITNNFTPPQYHIEMRECANGEWIYGVEDRTDSWYDAGVSITYLESEELPLPSGATSEEDDSWESDTDKRDVEW